MTWEINSIPGVILLTCMEDCTYLTSSSTEYPHHGEA
jgi:hypothetical protein